MSVRGFTLLEFLIGLFVTAILAAALTMAIKSSTALFQDAQSQLRSQSSLFSTLPYMNDALKSAKKITAVSLKDNDTGYLQYQTQDDQTISIFMNTQDNQTRFNASNSLSTHNIMATFSQGGNVSLPELMIASVVSFNIETYKEVPAHFQVISINNVVSVNLAEIISIKQSLVQSVNHQNSYFELVLDRIQTPLEDPGSISYGTASLPFSGITDLALTNLITVPSDAGNPDDGLRLSSLLKPVRIQNTGLYFDTIQSAIDAASAGDCIQIAETATPYTEALTLKSGIRLEGGYDVTTWVQNPYAHSTQIQPPAGFTNSTISATNVSDCTIDSLVIDSLFFKYGIYVENGSSITISNCRITNADRPIQFVNSTGIIQNNTVTGNEHGLYIYDSDNGVSILRNRFYSNNIVQVENVRLYDCENVTLKNNLIHSGYNAAKIINSSHITLANNVITDADNFGIHFKESVNATVINNVISRHTLGILVEFAAPPPDPFISIKHNLFTNNSFLDVLGITLQAGDNNVSTTIPNTTWENNNPYFIDIIDFYPSGDAASSILIDKGYAITGYNDRPHVNNALAADAPGIEDVRGDIGLYGGPSGGRVGPSMTWSLYPTQNSAIWYNSIDSAWPGDQILFHPGIFPITQTLAIVDHVRLHGYSPTHTQLDHQASGSLLQLYSGSTVSGIQLIGNGKVGAEVFSTTASQLHAMVFNACSTGAIYDDAIGTIRFTTFHNNTKDLTIGGSTIVTINYSVFSSSSLGIDHVGTTQAAGNYNLFHDCDTAFSGPYASNTDLNELTSPPLFWDTEVFQLHPSSSAINISSDIEAGAYEFYTNEGHFTIPAITSELKRGYNAVSVDLAGLATLNAFISTLETAVISDGIAVTLSPLAVITSNASPSPSWSIPVRALSKSLQVRMKLKSYTVNNSPYINTLTLDWKN